MAFVNLDAQVKILVGFVLIFGRYIGQLLYCQESQESKLHESLIPVAFKLCYALSAALGRCQLPLRNNPLAA
jgi:hypothetical protein